MTVQCLSYNEAFPNSQLVGSQIGQGSLEGLSNYDNATKLIGER
jgi:hypothetical protein